MVTESTRTLAAIAARRGYRKPTPTTKVCRCCEVEKPAEDFYHRGRDLHLLGPECKPCQNRQEITAARYAAHRDEYRERWRARGRVSYAVRVGNIPPARDLLCVDCGGQAAEYDHHLGYDPAHVLSVLPVCTVCHGRRKSARGEARNMYTKEAIQNG